MAFASASDLPHSDLTHVDSFMGCIVLPNGHRLSRPFGKFTKGVFLSDDQPVNTIDETRRTRLEMLIKRFGGKLANLNEALGYSWDGFFSPVVFLPLCHSSLPGGELLQILSIGYCVVVPKGYIITTNPQSSGEGVKSVNHYEPIPQACATQAVATGNPSAAGQARAAQSNPLPPSIAMGGRRPGRPRHFSRP